MDQAEIKGRIALELYKAAQALGARSDLLSIIGSYGHTLADEEVLWMLERHNEAGRGGDKAAQVHSLRPTRC